MKRLFKLLAFFLFSLWIGINPATQTVRAQSENQQEEFPPPTPAAERLNSYQTRLQLIENSLVKNVPFRSVGPTIMSGRVVDVDVNPDDPTIFYVAYASGGLWKTVNNGISFTPLFDRQMVMTIGDIAVDWKHGEIIWVGTGEVNSSRSSYSGTGIYRSEDGGKTWQYRGLPESHHIGRIVIHPQNPDIVWVAALGHLYSENPERGVYKTTDGGKSWRQVLFVDDTTGAVDLVMDPVNPDILYAAMWHRQRRAWNFVESGNGSGIYKSTDGGETWTLLTTPESGFPTGKGVGRIGLAIYPGNPNLIYAYLDNQFHRPKEKKKKYALTKAMLRTMTREEFLKVRKKDLEDFLRRNHFPKKYTAEVVRQMVKEGKIKPQALVEYLMDANQELFETPVIGAELYRSEDGGKTWKRTHQKYLDDMVYSYGYYFGGIQVAPDNPDKVYLMGVPLIKSEDGGKTFVSLGKENVHGDHHALWVNPHRKGHLILGNDGGINISFDDGEHWFKANTPPVGQFYTVNVDNDNPYHVYGGLQDNGVWYGPSTYKFSYRWYATGQYPYKMLLGGDGMQVEINPQDNNIVYAGFQFGNYFRIDRQSGKRQSVKPSHELGERPPRFNWETPIHLSPHNPDIFYIGANRLYRSMDGGKTFQAISPDLTAGGRKGDVPYGTLTTIDESPLRFGLIYVGSDDGLVHVTRDGGVTWQRISDSLPPHFWVSRVVASRHDTATVYVALNGYRWDNFTPLLYRSRDYGKSWERLGENLPLEPINVVAEDPVNPNLLYVGTDHLVYVSLDGGKTFMGMDKGLPHAPVHDLVIQEREKDLVVGTHGRSIYIANVKHLEQLTPELLAQAIHLFPLEKVKYSKNWGKRVYAWRDPVSPSLEIPFYLKSGGALTLTVRTDDGLVLKQWEAQGDRGLNYLKYDLTINPEVSKKYQKWLKKQFKQAEEREKYLPLEAADDGKIYLRPGTYQLEIRQEKQKASAKLRVKAPKPPKNGP